MRGTLSRVPSWDRRDGGQRCVRARVRAERRPARGAERSWSGGALRVGVVAFSGGSGTLNDRRFVYPATVRVAFYERNVPNSRPSGATFTVVPYAHAPVWVSDSHQSVIFFVINAHNFSSAGLVVRPSFELQSPCSVVCRCRVSCLSRCFDVVT
jgi:hypothetical protein